MNFNATSWTRPEQLMLTKGGSEKKLLEVPTPKVDKKPLTPTYAQKRKK